MTTREAALVEFGLEEGIPSHLSIIDGLSWWFEKQGLDEAQVREATHLAKHSEVPESAYWIRQQLTDIAESVTK